MAKKILAVVLAVMMAVSAMAITAFAEEIALYVTPHNQLGGYNPENNIVSKYKHVQVEYNIPVYALYGYMTSDYYMELVLPNVRVVNQWQDQYLNTTRRDPAVAWSIYYGGKEFKLQGGNGQTESFTQEVYFGIAVHDFINETLWTTIPQSTAYGDYPSIRLVADYYLNGDADWMVNVFPSNELNTNFYVQFKESKTGEDVPNSRSYINSWGAKKITSDDDKTYNYNKFVTADLSVANLADAAIYEVGNTISFDHTLKNRGLLASAGDDVKLVVELTEPIVGQATYTLWAKKQNYGQLTNWWQFNDARTYVSSVLVDGEVATLEFDVPAKVLFDATYGVMVDEFVIFENITLWNQTIMSSYLRVDGTKTNDWRIGSVGEISWDPNYDGTNQNFAKYKGKKVRYAAGGITDITYAATPVREMTDEEKAAADFVEAHTNEEGKFVTDIEAPEIVEPTEPATYTDPVTGEKDVPAPELNASKEYTWEHANGEKETSNIDDVVELLAVVEEPDATDAKYDASFKFDWRGRTIDQDTKFDTVDTPDAWENKTLADYKFKDVHDLLKYWNDAYEAKVGPDADTATKDAIIDAETKVAKAEANAAALKAAQAEYAEYAKKAYDNKRQYDAYVAAKAAYDQAVLDNADALLRYYASEEYKAYEKALADNEEATKKYEDEVAAQEADYNAKKALVDAYNALTEEANVNIHKYVPYQDNTPARALKMYLLFPEAETEDVNNAEEGTGNEEEGEDVNEGAEVDAPEEDEPTPAPEVSAPAADESNPGTGIALAVVPMLIAAAAAVVSKKH